MSHATDVWVRPVPQSFPSCLQHTAQSKPARPRIEIDLSRAKDQHLAYVEALRRAGCTVRRIDADHTAPDSVFVEDNALLIDHQAVLARPVMASRNAELLPVAGALRSAGFPVAELATGAVLDGGDCLICEDRLVVGLSTRTNAQAAASLQALFSGYRVETVPVPSGTLHLKSICSYLGENRLLVCGRFRDLPALAGFDLIVLPDDCEHGANCRRFGRFVICSAAHAVVAELLDRAGFTPLPVEISEFHKGDGAISCLSLVHHRRGQLAY